ncbi:hypothetical protein RJ53_06235 [Methanocalculus chunghsingensis]|uniref:ROK family protein n=1 Tax=Methanocalculus chunghsingensis TaxID=156457 RepID=A0A8J8B5I9_9EURY|nr:ROK family protein [Methanocalculus chunghsingensis]MBR1369114.1 hypothetical protein [Methanocalculus chunghsingensis]
MHDPDLRAGIDIGATWIRGGLIDQHGSLSSLIRMRTPTAGRSGAVVTEAVIAILDQILPETPPNSRIGIASAGPLDLRSGSVVASPNMAFDRIEIVSPVKERFGRPVTLINDCRAGALAEAASGAGRDLRDLVYLTFSSGIGGSVISGGRLLSGAGGNGGEVGHFYVDGRYGLICGCGGRGHFEAYASGTGIPRFYARFLEEEGEIGSVPDSADAILSSMDPVASKFKKELATVCGRGLSTIIAAYNPEAVIFDGPVVRNHPAFVPAMVSRVDRYLPVPDCLISPLGGDAPLIGAGVIAWREGSLDR